MVEKQFFEGTERESGGFEKGANEKENTRKELGIQNEVKIHERRG